MACCLVVAVRVRIGVGLDLVFGWLVVMHKYLYQLRLSLSHRCSRYRRRNTGIDVCRPILRPFVIKTALTSFTHLIKCHVICSESMSHIVATLFNASLSTGVFPDNFKHAIVIPHVKKSNSDSSELKNYRPVSNLPFLQNCLREYCCSNTAATSSGSAQTDAAVPVSISS